MASAVNETGSGFFMSSLSSCSEESVMEHCSGTGTAGTSGTTGIGEAAVNNGNGTNSRLVLVGGMDLKDIKDEPMEKTENKEDALEFLKEFSQNLQTMFGTISNQLAQFGKLANVINDLSTQVEGLTGQMREIQLMILKQSLSSQTPSPSPSTFGDCKAGNLFGPQDQVLQTPRKLMEQPMRHDVTPISTCSDTEKQQNGTNSAAIGNTRRSLAFSGSLETVLEESKENCIGTVTSKATTSNEGPTSTLSFMDFKSEAGTDESPHRRESKLGLLVLADVALTRTPSQSTFIHKVSDMFPDHDSGRSSAGSCRNSPSLSQDGKSLEKFNRYGTYNRGLHVSIAPKSDFLSGSSASSDAKLRKRRKMKQPLPCHFCGKCFNNQSSLRQHESFHRPLRPFKCENEKCDKAYKTRSELNRHLVVHSGEKKHECKICGKRFLRKQYLKTHLLRHHETGIAMVAPSAIESFKNDSTGTIPSIVVSSSFVSKAEPLTWRCQMCSKIFVNEEDLSRHVRSYHEKKKPAEGKSDINAQQCRGV